MTSSVTFYEPAPRQEVSTDTDGAHYITKREDDKRTLVLDWSDALGSDTISSVAYVDSGVTRSTTSNTTTTSTTTVTGLGEFEVTVTTAAGNILQQVWRFYSEEGPGRRHDYNR